MKKMRLNTYSLSKSISRALGTWKENFVSAAGLVIEKSHIEITSIPINISVSVSVGCDMLLYMH